MKKVVLLALILSLVVSTPRAHAEGDAPVNACGLVLGGVNDVVVTQHLNDRQAVFQFLTLDYPYLFSKTFIEGFFAKLNGRDYSKLSRAEQAKVAEETSASLYLTPGVQSFTVDVLRQEENSLKYIAERVELSYEATNRFQAIPPSVVQEVIRDVLLEKYGFYKAVRRYFTQDKLSIGDKLKLSGKWTAGTTVLGGAVSLFFFHSLLPVEIGIFLPTIVRGVTETRLRITHWLAGRKASEVMSLDSFRLSNSYAALLRDKNQDASQKSLAAPRSRSTDTVSLDYIRNIVPVADINNPKTIIELGEDIERGVHLFSNDLNLRSLQRQTAPTLLAFKRAVDEALNKTNKTGKTPVKLRALEDVIGDSLRSLQAQAKHELNENIQLQEAAEVLKGQFEKHQLFIEAMKALPEVTSREQLKVLIDDKEHELTEFQKTLTSGAQVLEQEQTQILAIRKVATNLMLYMTRRLSQVNSLDVLAADYEQLRSVQDALKNL